MRNLLNLNRLVAFFFVVIISFAVLATNSTPAYADAIPNKSTAKEIFQKLRGMGATPEVSAGVLGNMYQESTINPSATQSSSAKSFIKKGKLCDPSGLGSGAAVGLMQWDGSRRDAMLCHSEKKGLEWNSVDSQLEYGFITEMKKDDPFKIGAYGKNAAGKYCTGSGADCSKVRTKMSGVSEYFKGTDVGAATVEFVGYWERPGLPHSDVRVKMAKKVYKEFKDLPPIDLGKKVNDDDGGKKDDGGSSGGGGRPDESDLTGMPKTHDWDEGQTPKDAKLDDLDTGDQYNVEALKEDIRFQQEGATHTAQILVSLFGMLVMLWGVLFFSGMLLDKANPFLEFQMTRLLTLGRVEYVEDPADKGKGRYMGRQIAVRSGVAILLGLILVSGTFFGFTLSTILFLQDKF